MQAATSADANRERVIVILGATATGKTELAIRLAQELQTEIISGDSMLVYRGMDIGTAKPNLQERAGIPHHLIDILPPTANFSVADFVARAQEIITRLNAQGKIPIIAGGTGLYLKALLEGYKLNAVAEKSRFRERLTRLAERKGKSYLHTLLSRCDPAAAGRLHPNDSLRVIRALEVRRFGMESVSSSKMFTGDKLVYNALVIGLSRPRAELYRHINERVL